MIAIDIHDYIKEMEYSPKNFESKSFEEVKEDLKNLSEYHFIFDELEKCAFFKPENSIYLGNKKYIETKWLISDIAEKREIIERLNNLGLNLSLLKGAILENNSKKAVRMASIVMKNDYSSIRTITSELNSFREKIDELDKTHNYILKSDILSLDIKMLLQEDIAKKKKLEEAYSNQVEVLINLSKAFISMTKDSLLKKK